MHLLVPDYILRTGNLKMAVLLACRSRSMHGRRELHH
jgi:hypothetical protein